jgi:hypothetical protein
MYHEATVALLRGDENCGRADVDDDDLDGSPAFFAKLI